MLRIFGSTIQTHFIIFYLFRFNAFIPLSFEDLFTLYLSLALNVLHIVHTIQYNNIEINLNKLNEQHTRKKN